MKIKESKFIISAVEPSQYPAADLPEIAFAGRSNVGKSSLINMMLNRKNLAKTSGRPGKTQTINFFDIDQLFRVVDLPGYGFARVAKSHKRRWGEYIETYLNTRQNLIEVFLLVDIRHTPNELDKLMYDYIIAAGFSGYVVATKLDKIKNNQLMSCLNDIKVTLGVAENHFITPLSSSNRKGKYKLWQRLNELFEAHGYDIYFERQSTAQSVQRRSAKKKKR